MKERGKERNSIFDNERYFRGCMWSARIRSKVDGDARAWIRLRARRVHARSLRAGWGGDAFDSGGHPCGSGGGGSSGENYESWSTRVAERQRSATMVGGRGSSESLETLTMLSLSTQFRKQSQSREYYTRSVFVSGSASSFSICSRYQFSRSYPCFRFCYSIGSGEPSWTLVRSTRINPRHRRRKKESRDQQLRNSR